MTKELIKIGMCVKMRGGARIWIEKEKAESLINVITTTNTPFVHIGDELINTQNIEGVFSPTTMQEIDNEKGGYRCTKIEGVWHPRGEKCEHFNNLGYKI